MKPFCIGLIAFALSAQSSFSNAAGDPVNGRALYQARCSACHSPDFNGVGPAHRGVFGRGAGQAPGFAYSPALKASGLVWNALTLDRWLADPQQLVPGQRMGVNVPEAADRADLIAFLEQISAKKE